MMEKKTKGTLPADLGSEYTVLSELKSGKSGQVLLIYDTVCRRKAILKIAYSRLELLETEAAAMSALAGEGIPVVYNCRISDNCGWLLREYIPGETLDEYVKKNGTLSADETVSLGIALCRVVGRMHLHEPRMIHRDIKPQNVVRKKDGSLCLIDFGTCREYDASSSCDTQIIGTPVSAPPEQFGYCQTDARSDVYSIGMLLNFLSTGEYALDKRSASPQLKSVIEKCTCFAPNDRYSDALELQRALEALSPSSRLRRRILLCSAALAVIAAVIIILPIAVRGISAALASVGAEERISADPQIEAEEYIFADPTIKAEVCRQLGKDVITYGDLNGITELMLIGNTPVEEWDSISVVGSSIAVNGVGINDSGGICTLKDIEAMPNLHTLVLCNQEISDLSPLSGSKIERLALNSNNISDITPLSRCASLSELVIGGNPVSVLTPLLECKQLSYLEIGKTRVNNFEVISKLPELLSLNIAFCEYLTDLSPLAEMDDLRELTVFHADNETLELIYGMTGLVKLEVWCSDEVPDFNGISRLVNLQHLLLSVLDGNALLSFDGIEKLPRLYYMFISGARCADVSAIGKSRSLSTISFEDCEIDDFSALGEIDGLHQVECSIADYDKIMAALAENRAVSVTIR